MDERSRMDAGADGEAAALAHLQAHGLQLVLRNYRCRSGEIDLVMLDRQVLVLAEVRYRGSADFGGAAASVTRRKQRRIITAAKHLLVMRPQLRRYAARFDVIAIEDSPAGRRIDWIRHAFSL